MNIYKSKTKKNLLDIATEYGIRGRHNYSKNELITALQMYENNPVYDELKKEIEKRGALLFQLLLYLESFEEFWLLDTY